MKYFNPDNKFTKNETSYQRLKLTILSLIILAFFLFEIWFQHHIFFNEDISWLMHSGLRLLAGGNYTHNFFEVNPPMSIFIYLPAVLIANVTKTSFIVTSLWYELCIVSYSLICCAILSRKIFSNKQNNQRILFLMILSFIFIILPCRQFGQREHLMLMLIMPYLLLMVNRILNFLVEAKKSSQFFYLTIGLCAGIGFNIKPFFLLTFIALEGYFVIKKHCLTAWIRPESLFVVAVSILYLVAIMLVTPDYITTILPLTINSYYASFADSFPVVIGQLLSIFVFITCTFYFTLRHYQQNIVLLDVLQISLLSLWVIYIMQRTIWYYHLYPALAVGFLLLTLLIYNIWFATNIKIKVKIISLTLLCCLAIIPIYSLYNGIKIPIETKNISNKAQLVQFLHDNAISGPIFFFSDLISSTYPLVDLAPVYSVSRFPCLWMLLKLQSTSLTLDNKQTIDFFKRAIVDDLITAKPKLVFVQLSSPNWNKTKGEINFIKFFLSDPRFNQLWREYHYSTTIGKYAIYTLR